jgi:hypothetical protein
VLLDIGLDLVAQVVHLLDGASRLHQEVQLYVAQAAGAAGAQVVEAAHLGKALEDALADLPFVLLGQAHVHDLRHRVPQQPKGGEPQIGGQQQRHDRVEQVDAGDTHQHQSREHRQRLDDVGLEVLSVGSESEGFGGLGRLAHVARD